GVVEQAGDILRVPVDMATFQQAVSGRSGRHQQSGNMSPGAVARRLEASAQREDDHPQEHPYTTVGEVQQHFVHRLFYPYQQVLHAPAEQGQVLLRLALVMEMLETGAGQIEKAEHVAEPGGQALPALELATEHQHAD